MKTLTTELRELLGGNIFWMADLFTITPVGLSAIYYTSMDTSLTYGGHIYLHNGLLIDRSKCSWKNDFSVDTMELTITPQFDMTNGQPVTNSLINGKPFLQAVKDGILDKATVKLDRAFGYPGSISITGIVPSMFLGYIGDAELYRTYAKVTVNSMLELLNTQFPRNLYESTCIHTLYDTGCGVLQASNTITGHVTADQGGGSADKNTVPTDISTAVAIYANGVITFTSGDNSGISRTIGDWDGKTAFLANPLPYNPVIGNAFTISKGCDKTTSTCSSRFNNLQHFRGFPWIPTAETAL
jgi:hypothetical protein